MVGDVRLSVVKIVAEGDPVLGRIEIRLVQTQQVICLRLHLLWRPIAPVVSFRSETLDKNQKSNDTMIRHWWTDRWTWKEKYKKSRMYCNLKKKRILPVLTTRHRPGNRLYDWDRYRQKMEEFSRDFLLASCHRILQVWRKKSIEWKRYSEKER